MKGQDEIFEGNKNTKLNINFILVTKVYEIQLIVSIHVYAGLLPGFWKKINCAGFLRQMVRGKKLRLCGVDCAMF